MQLNAETLTKLENDLRDATQLINFLKSAAQNLEQAKLTEIGSLTTKIQTLESRYLQKKKKWKEGVQMNMTKLKQ